MTPNVFEHYGTPADLKPFPESKRREAAIASGLRLIAHCCGIELEEPLQIDAMGEFRIVTADKFGEKFAALLNASGGARTGVNPTRFMSPENNWCRLNHFAAQSICESVIRFDLDCVEFVS